MLTLFLVLSLLFYCFMLLSAGGEVFNMTLHRWEWVLVAFFGMMAFFSGQMLAQHGWKGL